MRKPAAEMYGDASPKRCSDALPHTGPIVRPRLSTALAAPCTRPCSSARAARLIEAGHRRMAEADAQRQRDQRSAKNADGVRQRGGHEADGGADQAEHERLLVAEPLDDASG